MNKRIEYIDAMRGFTMILVVYAHIRFYGYHIDDYSDAFSFNSLFMLIRMPLFFFVSGFLFYKDTWNKDNLKLFFKRKTQVQIGSTLFFMSIYAFIFGYNFIDGLFDSYKLGYWFTITLFNFYIAFFLLNYIINKLGIKNNLIDNTWITIALLLHFITTTKSMQALGINGLLSGLLSINMFKYFIFFIVGILVKKHFTNYEKLVGKNYFTTTILLAFWILVVPYLKFKSHLNNPWIEHFAFLCIGILGIFIIFLFFNKYSDSFSINTKTGKCLQYIGKRTLDIYLLHYLFLPRDLGCLGSIFNDFKNPCIELFVSSFLALSVIGLCLIVSNIIRISNPLSYYLLGMKSKN